MKKKDRRIRLFLEIFFLAVGIYIIGIKAWGFYAEVVPGRLFEFYEGSIPVFGLVAHVFAGLSCFIASWSLWARVPWSAGWGMFTMGLILYGNISSMGTAIFEHPARAIPMVIIVLVVMQSFPFMMKDTQRY